MDGAHQQAGSTETSLGFLDSLNWPTIVYAMATIPVGFLCFMSTQSEKRTQRKRKETARGSRFCPNRNTNVGGPLQNNGILGNPPKRNEQPKTTSTDDSSPLDAHSSKQGGKMVDLWTQPSLAAQRTNLIKKTGVRAIAVEPQERVDLAQMPPAKPARTNHYHGAKPRLQCLFWLAAWMVLGFALFGYGVFSSTPGGGDSSVSLSPDVTTLAKPIEEIQVGERVQFARNPGEPFDNSLGTKVDPSTWRRISLRAYKDSGDKADIVLLRPKWWLDERLDTKRGTLTLAVPELNIFEPAKVLSVEPCPPISDGAGGVVIATFHHWSPDTVNVHIKGVDRPIRCTPDHTFWSSDRREFVEAQHLNQGELVQGEHSEYQIGRIARINEPIEVFNLEIHGQHVYQVSEFGVLVHNMPTGGPKKRKIRDLDPSDITEEMILDEDLFDVKDIDDWFHEVEQNLTPEQRRAVDEWINTRRARDPNWNIDNNDPTWQDYDELFND